MDLATLYGMETKQLKRAVKRNINRFPEDFMFELTPGELAEWRRQFVTSNRIRMGLRIPPLAFPEHGILMLASVLKSDRAAFVNIRIVRVFVKMREYLATNKHLTGGLSLLENTVADHDEKIRLLFDYLEQLRDDRQAEQDFQNRPLIGFKTGRENVE